MKWLEPSVGQSGHLGSKSTRQEVVTTAKRKTDTKERELMRKVSRLAVVAAAVAAFVLSATWYAAFGGVMMRLSGVDPATAASTATPAWTMLFVVAQSLVVASMLAYFVSRLGIVNWKGAVRLGALVWIFPACILVGSVVHENVPFMLAAIHAGDWLAKLLLMSLILGLWRGGRRASKGAG